MRQAVGLYDASTLGKIDVRGPDACRFLNLVYTNAWDNLAIGHCKYGMMLNERGMIIDDGITARLGDSHYHMTTTSGQANSTLAWLEEWLQVELAAPGRTPDGCGGTVGCLRPGRADGPGRAAKADGPRHEPRCLPLHDHRRTRAWLVSMRGSRA